jgi:hypothetical protein
VVLFWTHTNHLMGAHFLTRRHLDLLGFNIVSKNWHPLVSLFPKDVSSSRVAPELRGMKDPESSCPLESLESKKTDEGSDAVAPSNHG